LLHFEFDSATDVDVVVNPSRFQRIDENADVIAKPPISRRELEATIGAAAHNLDEEHL